MSIKSYYRLTKPGIVYGNGIHTIAGSLFAIAAYDRGWIQTFAILIGSSLVIASAGVINNFTDRSIDVHMKRTRTRPSVDGSISTASGVVFALLLFLAGVMCIAIYTNILTVSLGIIAYVWYLTLYAYAKRRSPIGTLVGTIPGALPIIAGYTAISGVMTTQALTLGLLLVMWQMAHFYAIAVFRRAEYDEAGVPVVSTRCPFSSVRMRILSYLSLYGVVAAGILVSNTLPLVPSVIIMLGAVYWMIIALKPSEDSMRWSRSVFGASLVLTVVLVSASVVAIAVA